MPRWLLSSLGGLSAVVTAVAVAATAFAAITLRGPSSDDLVRDMATIDRELALAERTLVAYHGRPLMAQQIELRMAVL